MSHTQTVRIAGIIRQSIVDGPGLRFVLFTQGCPHNCEGCHNPETHDYDGGYDCDINKILAAIDQNPLLKGLTISGGEPFARPGELVPLVQQVRERGKNIWCYSGYTYEQLCEMAQQDQNVHTLLSMIDVLVDGQFILAEKDLTLSFMGSRNQRTIDVAASLEQNQVVIVNQL